MKTTFIFLACMLGIATADKNDEYDEYWANRYLSDDQANRAKILQKDCNSKAKEISSQDCKQECNVTEPGEDCAKCIAKHQEYDYDCKDDMVSMRCLDIYDKLERQDCKEQCLDSDPDSPDDPCEPCIMNHKDTGLAFLNFLPCRGKCPTSSTWSGLGQVLTTQILE